MHIHLPFLKKQLAKRKEHKLYEMKPIGSAIRYKRKEMNLTLEEACEGICSISYLSKLENNQIEPGNRFLNQLIERFQIHESFEVDTSQYEEDKRQIAQSLLFERELHYAILDEYDDRDDYQAYLIHMYVAVFSKNNDLAMKKYNSIRGYVCNLKDDELTIFFILTSIILYREHKFSEAYELLQLMPELSHDTYEHLNLLTSKLLLKNAFRMNKRSEITINYTPYVNRLVELNLYELINAIKGDFITYEASYLHHRLVYKTTERMVHFSEEDKNYVHAKAFYHKSDYLQTYQLAKKYYKNKSKWLVLYLMAVDQLQKNDEMIHILSHVDDLLDICYGSSILLLHMKHKYLSSKEQLLEYLRKNILGFTHLTDEYTLLDFIMMDAQNLFSKYQYYKEAVQVTSKILPRLKTLNQAN
ncbi:MAG: helix-turn-helix transcriptional regulator [Acholeplasmataceae bacterium]|jgi:transcriptional regulator with XRE-family HTH domain|nr:helix-turn-helix transcriptional regulator [Acholeplasmataceae bacterium]